jgi:hypothetical protein
MLVMNPTLPAAPGTLYHLVVSRGVVKIRAGKVKERDGGVRGYEEYEGRED